MEARGKEILCLCYDSNMLQVRRMLLEHFGYVVLSSTSVDDAKLMVREHCPDMLLMDNNDSGVDFEQLAQHAKGVCPEIITVMLSPYYYGSRGASTEAIDRIVAKDDGPDGLISHIEELLGRVDAASRSAIRPM